MYTALMSGFAVSRLSKPEEALSAFHSAATSSTWTSGYLVFMHCRNASERSRPLTEARSPMTCTTLPDVTFAPIASQALVPYALLSARTTIATLPPSGATSTATTGTPLFSAALRPATTAAESSGVTTRPLTPWLSRVLMSVICFAGSLSALTVGSASTPCSFAFSGT